MTRDTDADGDELAIEHCLWAASRGLRPEDVIASVANVPPADGPATWHTAQFALKTALTAARQDSAAIRKASREP